MTENEQIQEMARNDDKKIIKGLECCQTPTPIDCRNCGYKDQTTSEYKGCVNLLVADALSLIKRLNEENSWLRFRNNQLKRYDEERDIALHARLINDTRAETVRKMQADGYRKVERGEWVTVHTPFYRPIYYRCSVCGYEVHDPSNGDTNYCPNCGADMRGEENERV